MRSIGKKNIKLVREITKKAISNCPSWNIGGLEEYITQELLLGSLWDIWEGADCESFI